MQEGHSLYSALLKTLLQMRTLMITGPGLFLDTEESMAEMHKR